MTETQTELKDSNIDLKGSTVEFINELLDESFAKDDIYNFIAEHGEDDFVNYYEEYVNVGEEYCYEAVDAFIAAFGIECLSHFSDAYQGSYESEAYFAEEYVNEVECITIPSYIVVDWQATWDYNLRHDFVYEVCGTQGFVFNRNF